MKTLKYIIGAFVLAVGLNACVGDLNVTPIDPQMNTADKALQTEGDYFALLAQCYAGFSHSGSYGPNGNNNISGIDGGFSQYFRGRYHLNGLTTDEAICGWNDQTLQDLHGLAWTTTDVFVAAFYYRIFYQISACNEFLRKVNIATIELPNAEQWKAEARALRAFCWLEAIDNYGNVPFADETAPVGAYVPEQISRADLFNYVEGELKDLIDNSALYDAAAGEYGRINKGAAIMMLAKLYLNAEVYIGEKKYKECVEVLNKLDGKYSLHTKPNGKFSAFQDLFLADNNKCTDEIIWAVEQDGNNVQSYGVTNYIIFASTGGKMDTNEAGISSGWGGLRTTPEFYQKFSSADKRNLFHTKDHQAEIDEIGTFTHGYAFTKFRNVQSDGVIPNQTVTIDEKTGEEKRANPGFVDTDFPVYRYADALLMKAECAKRDATITVDGLAALNAVRNRAGLGSVTSYELDEVLDERAREFVQEGWRRQDLIRFGKFTTSDYLWSWKGGVKAGKSVASHMNLFPIPETDKNANPNLEQNSGY